MRSRETTKNNRQPESVYATTPSGRKQVVISSHLSSPSEIHWTMLGESHLFVKENYVLFKIANIFIFIVFICLPTISVYCFYILKQKFANRGIWTFFLAPSGFKLSRVHCVPTQPFYLLPPTSTPSSLNNVLTSKNSNFLNIYFEYISLYVWTQLKNHVFFLIWHCWKEWVTCVFYLWQFPTKKCYFTPIWYFTPACCVTIKM